MGVHLQLQNRKILSYVHLRFAKWEHFPRPLQGPIWPIIGSDKRNHGTPLKNQKINCNLIKLYVKKRTNLWITNVNW